MLLGCLTFCGGDKITSDVPPAPFVQVDEKTLFKKLLYYKENPIVTNNLIDKQQRWAKKYTDSKYVAQKILADL